MTKNKKLLIAILIVATIALAGISIIITTAIGNRNLESQTGAQTNPILANCDSTTGICSIPTGVCNPSKVYLHFCNELKKDNEKCVSTTPVELPVSPLSAGRTVNLNDYLNNVSCGTVQMYLELENSGVNSLGACGTIMKRFSSACSVGIITPTSFPVSYTTGNTNTGSNSGNNGNITTGTGNGTTTTGTTQFANPQFTITSTYAPSCDVSGDALLNYTLIVSNVSSVSGTITKIEEVIDSSLTANSITPTSISNSGTYSTNKITWTESSTARNYTAGQSKNFTYQIRIPKAKLATFTNGTNSSATVTYDTSNTIGNTNTFALLSKHNCAIQTTNTVVTGNNSLPNTAITDDFKLLIVGILFILAAIFVFRFRIGENTINNLFNKRRK